MAPSWEASRRRLSDGFLRMDNLVHPLAEFFVELGRFAEHQRENLVACYDLRQVQIGLQKSRSHRRPARGKRVSVQKDSGIVSGVETVRIVQEGVLQPQAADHVARAVEAACWRNRALRPDAQAVRGLGGLRMSSNVSQSGCEGLVAWNASFAQERPLNKSPGNDSRPDRPALSESSAP